MVTSVDWTKYGFVIASGYRKNIVLSIGKGPKTPKQISVETKIRLNHVSTIIGVLEEKGIVRCLTPDLSKGKIFDLTDDGRKILKQIKSME